MYGLERGRGRLLGNDNRHDMTGKILVPSAKVHGSQLHALKCFLESEVL